jgi:hypothetical protein
MNLEEERAQNVEGCTSLRTESSGELMPALKRTGTIKAVK